MNTKPEHSAAAEVVLKPCPFCGSSGVFTERGMLCAGCEDPDCIGHQIAYDFITNDDAAAHWNRRSTPSLSGGGSFEARAVELVQKHGNPNGTDYEQGQNDMGHRMVTLAQDADRAIAAGSGSSVGLRISFSPSGPHGCAVVSPDEPAEGVYWTLIGSGPDHIQNDLARQIVERLNAPEQTDGSRGELPEEWFYTRDEHVWSGSFKTREEAISEGRNDYGPDAAFKVACGGFSTPWPELFDHKEALLNFVDETHEDRKFEDSFTDEADLPDSVWEELRSALNASWTTWTAKHRPHSRALELGGAEEIKAATGAPK
jgi:hypothetical protein